MSELFHEYNEKWVKVNKKGSIADITYQKYLHQLRILKLIAPKLKMSDINKYEYQKIINIYAETHQRQTIIDFHHHIKASLIDAYSDGLVDRNPTIRIKIPEGTKRVATHEKFWDVEEYEKFLKFLYTKRDICRDDFLLLLIAKTGMRFAEALGLCPEDFYFERKRISINKTLNYKIKIWKFQPTKNFSSNREVLIDHQTSVIFKNFIENKAQGEPVFVSEGDRIYNSTVNNRLFNYCKQLDLKKISIHSLRHTYASVMLTSDVSVESIAKYLGHSDTTVTRKVYLHLTKEMASSDDKKMEKVLSKF